MGKKPSKMKKEPYIRRCVNCGQPMIATKVMGKPGGMYWICQNCVERVKI